MHYRIAHSKFRSTGFLTRLKQFALGTTGPVRSRSGVAAIEFALVAPMLVITIAGLYDLTTAFVAWKRVALAAQAIDEIATSLAATVKGTNQLNLDQATKSASAIYAYLPKTLAAAPPPYGVVISSIVMQPTVYTCTIGCTYLPHVAWSGVYEGSGTLRPCDVTPGVKDVTYGTPSILFVPNTASQNPYTLPTDLQGVAPLLVVDVNYTYIPMFFKFITGNIVMSQSAYFSPRTGLADAWVHYYSAGPSDSTVFCGPPAIYPAAATSTVP